MAMFRDDFEGTGAMQDFVTEFNRMAKALNNMQVNMPRDYSGLPATANIDDEKLVIDFGDSSFKDPE